MAKKPTENPKLKIKFHARDFALMAVQYLASKREDESLPLEVRIFAAEQILAIHRKYGTPGVKEKYAGRKPIPNYLRFHILARDGYRCQYCGRRAPDVILHVDHIKPFSRGGRTEESNLKTACRDCNNGKSDHLVSN